MDKLDRSWVCDVQLGIRQTLKRDSTLPAFGAGVVKRGQTLQLATEKQPCNPQHHISRYLWAPVLACHPHPPFLIPASVFPG